MPVRVDFSKDHLVVDGLESVWLCNIDRVRLPNAKMKVVTRNKLLVNNCLRRRVDARDTLQDRIRQSVGKLRVDDVIWELWHIELTKPDGTVFEPARPMIIIPVNKPEEKWEILAVDTATLNSRFRVFARK